jgi:hypothetical protein
MRFYANSLSNHFPTKSLTTNRLYILTKPHKIINHQQITKKTKPLNPKK